VFFALRVSVFYISTDQLLQMINLLDGNASHNLSAVVTFTSRDLVMPKGVDGGGGQPPPQGIQNIQPVRCDDHPDGRKGGSQQVVSGYPVYPRRRDQRPVEIVHKDAVSQITVYIAGSVPPI